MGCRPRLRAPCAPQHGGRGAPPALPSVVSQMLPGRLVIAICLYHPCCKAVQGSAKPAGHGLAGVRSGHQPPAGRPLGARLIAAVVPQARALQTFHAWFLCTMLTALQHARADVMAAPRIPDPLTLAELSAKRHSIDAALRH